MPRAPTVKKMIGPALLWKRGLAFIIDMLIVNLIIAYPFRSLIQSLVPATTFSDTYALLETNTIMMDKLYMIIGTMTVLTILYFAIMELMTRQTIGKMVMNIYVKSDYKQLKFWQTIVRRLFMIPVVPFILLWFIDPLYMFFSKDNRRFSEVFAKTKVIGEYILYR